jgi:hypothetical protein
VQPRGLGGAKGSGGQPGTRRACGAPQAHLLHRTRSNFFPSILLHRTFRTSTAQSALHLAAVAADCALPLLHLASRPVAGGRTARYARTSALFTCLHTATFLCHLLPWPPSPNQETQINSEKNSNRLQSIALQFIGSIIDHPCHHACALPDCSGRSEWRRWLPSPVRAVSDCLSTA